MYTPDIALLIGRIIAAKTALARSAKTKRNSENSSNRGARFGAVRAFRPAFRRSRRVTPISGI
jgi:hypothetical protein